MVSNLELAILAMDSYNRGPDRGMVLAGGAIGRFTLDTAEADGSFFGQAYVAAGDTIISYRGTDGLGDVLSWVGALGHDTAQARAAAAFYQGVTGGISASSNIYVTGHSLGGGHAGLIGTLYAARDQFARAFRER